MQTMQGFVATKNFGVVTVKATHFPATTWVPPDAPHRVFNILEDARIGRHLLHIFFGENVTGRDWMEENDCVGHIGRSMGPKKVLLLVEPGEDGGPEISMSSIVKIVRFTRVPTVLYQHPAFNQPTMEIVASEIPGYNATVLCNGSVHANFKTVAQAEKWIKFMKGEVVKA